jgi:parallel beta-helix repeat protein
MHLISLSDSMVSGNTCLNNWWHGIMLGGTSNNDTLSDNDCSYSQYGIYLDSSGNNDMLTLNKPHDNTGYGIYATAGAGRNTIWNNTLTGNNGVGVQAYDNGANNRWNSSSGCGNWWSDWTTPDAVAPFGIVDLPYDISGSAGEKDYYPLAVQPGTPYVPRPAIAIDGNADFATQAAAELWNGEGTPGNPYIIQGYEIVASSAHGISIQNVDAHFVVRTCYIHDGGSGYIGIYLNNCVNGSLSSNICSNDMVGIYLESSNGVTVSDNTCTGNYYAMYLYDSDGNTVSGNNCDYNYECGIYLESSSGNVLIDNMCSSDNYGIYLTLYDIDPSDLNIIDNNVCHYNFIGIFLEWTGNDTLTENDCTESDYGIALLNSDGNTLSDNNCSYDSECGIYLEASSENTLSGNNCSGDYYGIFLTYQVTEEWDEDLGEYVYTYYGSDSNALIDNVCLINYIGIYLDSSNGNTLINNLCIWNYGDDCGIYLHDSDDNAISGNNCSENDDGIYIDSSSGNTISDNICSNNYYDGIYLYDSSHNTLDGNNCSYNQYGVYLASSSSNDITHSQLCVNSPYGVYVDSGSDSNTIWNNTFIGNNGAGDMYDPAYIQAYDEGWGDWWNTTGLSYNYGNYWSDWKTPDIVSPLGIVDEPYILGGGGGGGGGRDYYPRAATTCTITSPTSASTYFTNWGYLKLIGAAYDETAVTSVTWSNSLGGSGIAYMTPQFGGPTVTWQSRGNVQLFLGVNVITVVALDALGNTATDVLTVTYEKVLPIITITSPTSNPTYSTDSGTIDLAGSASDDSGIATVTWKNVATGASGTASGTDSWSITGISLNVGLNLIYVNATDNAGNRGSDKIWVTCSIDTLTVTITNPTSSPTMTTGWHMILLKGTASDDMKVTSVVWSNSLGGSGVAYMVPQWGGASVTWQSRGNVMLYSGDNVITVTAYDSVGNSRTDVLTVTYTGP